MFLKYAVGAGTALAISIVGVSGPALAKVEGDTITLGSALSFTGKYATNGIHTQRGYDFAVDKKTTQKNKKKQRTNCKQQERKQKRKSKKDKGENTEAK